MIGVSRTRDLSRQLVHRATSRIVAAESPSLSSSSYRGMSAALRPRCRHASSSSNSAGESRKFKSEEDMLEYLRQADKTLQRYEEARQMYKRGEFPRQQARSSSYGGASSSSAKNLAQMGILGVFIVAFMATPLVGKKIATDEEFRSRWIPSWYDFTVKKPENPWTREELHEQMVRVQKDLRERAIRGEFTKEKLEEMRKSFEYHKFPGRDDIKGAAAGSDKSSSSSSRPEGWDRIHPGIESDSDVNEA